MSHLSKTLDEYVKDQLRQIITKQSKRSSSIDRSLMLANIRPGLSMYKNFIFTQRVRTRAGSAEFINQRFSSYPSPRLQSQNMIMKGSPRRNRFRSGVIRTQFFAKHTTVITAACLYVIFVKSKLIAVPSSLKDKASIQFSHYRLLDQNKGKLQINSLVRHVHSFMYAAENYHKALPQITSEPPYEIKKLINQSFMRLQRLGSQRYHSRALKESCIIHFIQERGIYRLLAEPIANVFFKRYCKLTIDSYYDFAKNYFLTGYNISRVRIGFDIYSWNQKQVIHSNDLYKYFECAFFNVIEPDLVSINKGFYQKQKNQVVKLLNNRKGRLLQKHFNTKNWQNFTKDQKVSGMNFQEFCELNFYQQCPNVVILAVYLLFGQKFVDFMTDQLNYDCFVIKEKAGKVKMYRQFVDEVSYRKWYKDEKEYLLQSIKRTNIPHQYWNGLVSIYLLLCDIKAANKTQMFYINLKSWTKYNKIIFPKYAQIITNRFYQKLNLLAIGQVNFSAFHKCLNSFFNPNKWIETQFSFWDGNQNGKIEVEDLLDIAQNQEYNIHPLIKSECTQQLLLSLIDLLKQNHSISIKKNYVSKEKFVEDITIPSFSEYFQDKFIEIEKQEKNLLGKMLSRLTYKPQSIT